MINQDRKDNANAIINEHFILCQMGLLETVYIKNQDIDKVMDYFIKNIYNANNIDITGWNKK